LKPLFPSYRALLPILGLRPLICSDGVSLKMLHCVSHLVSVKIYQHTSPAVFTTPWSQFPRFLRSFLRSIELPWQVRIRVISGRVTTKFHSSQICTTFGYLGVGL